MARILSSNPLSKSNVVRYDIYSPLVFKDAVNPTVAELNTASKDLHLQATCSLSRDNTSINHVPGVTDESLTLCDTASREDVISLDVELTLSGFMHPDRFSDDDQNQLYQWLKNSGREYIVAVRYGDSTKTVDVPFKAGDSVYMIKIVTDYIVLDTSGDVFTWTQEPQRTLLASNVGVA